MEIIKKYDYELTKNEIHQIFQIYNDCFYQNNINKKAQITLAKRWISKYHLFQWYLLIKDKHIIGIASYVYDVSNADRFDINQEMGENVCNVGIKTEHRRRGYAKQLIKEMMNDYKQLIVEIKRNNPNYVQLIKLYEGLDFKMMDQKENQNFYLLLL